MHCYRMCARHCKACWRHRTASAGNNTLLQQLTKIVACFQAAHENETMQNKCARNVLCAKKYQKEKKQLPWRALALVLSPSLSFSIAAYYVPCELCCTHACCIKNYECICRTRSTSAAIATATASNAVSTCVET